MPAGRRWEPHFIVAAEVQQALIEAELAGAAHNSELDFIR